MLLLLQSQEPAPEFVNASCAMPTFAGADESADGRLTYVVLSRY